MAAFNLEESFSAVALFTTLTVSPVSFTVASFERLFPGLSFEDVDEALEAADFFAILLFDLLELEVGLVLGALLDVREALEDLVFEAVFFTPLGAFV